MPTSFVQMRSLRCILHSIIMAIICHQGLVQSAQVSSESSIIVYNGTHIAALVAERKTLIIACIYIDPQTRHIELPSDTLTIYDVPVGKFLEIVPPDPTTSFQRVLAISDDIDSLVQSISQGKKDSIYKIHNHKVLFVSLEYISELTRHLYIGWFHDALRRFDTPELLAVAAGYKGAVTFGKRPASNIALKVVTPGAYEGQDKQQMDNMPSRRKKREKKALPVMTELEAYRIMGIRPEASLNELERAYRELYDMYHGQRHNTSVEAKIWRDIENAYHILQIALVQKKSSDEYVHKESGLEKHDQESPKAPAQEMAHDNGYRAAIEHTSEAAL